MRRRPEADLYLAELAAFLERRQVVLRELEEEEERLLLEAKRARLSWYAIACVYGVSQQALRQRFSRLERRLVHARAVARRAPGAIPAKSSWND